MYNFFDELRTYLEYLSVVTISEPIEIKPLSPPPAWEPIRIAIIINTRIQVFVESVQELLCERR